MKAIIFTKYGASDVLQLTEVAKRNLAMASLHIRAVTLTDSLWLVDNRRAGRWTAGERRDDGKVWL